MNAPSAASASMTHSTSTPRSAATSAGFGERPSFWVRSLEAFAMPPWSSCTRRGGRTDQPKSRKNRFTSPATVGTA